MKTFKEYLNEGHFSDDEMKKIKKHYADNSEMQRRLETYKTAEIQGNKKRAGEMAQAIKKTAKEDMVLESIVHSSNKKLQIKSGGTEMLLSATPSGVNIFIQEGSERILYEAKLSDVIALKEFFDKRSF